MARTDEPKGYPFAEEEREQRGGSGFFRTVVILLLVTLVALVLLLLRVRYERDAFPTPETSEGPAAAVTPTPTPEPLEEPQPTLTPSPAKNRPAPSFDGVVPALPGLAQYNPIPDIFEAVSPSIVGVINYVESKGLTKKILIPRGAGTGYLVSNEGYVVTNAHVVKGAVAVTVQLTNGNEIDAELIGADTESDVAVLRIDSTGMVPLALGESDAVRVGEYALAIGNPIEQELANTLTLGIISATAREIRIDNFTNTYLQTDAAINFGNSGGPLLNMRGEVIGMNSAKTLNAGYDDFGNAISAEGIGFAIPINQVVKIMNALIKDGEIVRPGIGVTISTVTEQIAETEGLPYGAYVQSVVKGGAADRGGLKAGDVITACNGEEITEIESLVAMVSACMIGDELELVVMRGEEVIELTLIIENRTKLDFDKLAD